jgi:hypothetical protein
LVVALFWFYIDPFFLTEDENEAIQQVNTVKGSSDEKACITNLDISSLQIASPDVVPRFVTDGHGPSPKSKANEKSSDDVWEWDGSVDEDAHLDLD